MGSNSIYIVSVMKGKEYKNVYRTGYGTFHKSA